MDYGLWVEWIGYAASAGIVISLLMTSIKKLRIINTIGCILFVIYGVFVKAYPVVISNSLIVLINIYNLFMINKGNIKE